MEDDKTRSMASGEKRTKDVFLKTPNLKITFASGSSTLLNCCDNGNGEISNCPINYDIQDLRSKICQLERENQSLKTENLVLRSSLDKQKFDLVCKKLEETKSELVAHRLEATEMRKTFERRLTVLFNKRCAERKARMYFSRNLKLEYCGKKILEKHLKVEQRKIRILESQAREMQNDLAEVHRKLIAECSHPRIETEFVSHFPSISQNLCLCGRSKLKIKGGKRLKQRQSRRELFRNMSSDLQKSFCARCFRKCDSTLLNNIC